ncbi:Mitochondrial dicarboxylate carrier [Amphibalanus amphitrite]|uniref:Mitochondrial dicarboxylate carrier n=1 Tax=Amphibalanus amphitrite TaxID=1232801 RepID=A0A6A4WFD2_AMPAM|nr:Mitochondrial dicarboxylate carrier [Amphibalanus amphitrite]
MANEARISKWYFGGLASAGAACFTHPLDLLKVHLQTQQKKLSVGRNVVNIVRSQGMLALYSGLSAALLRQLTYSTFRFAAYEAAKQQFSSPGQPVPFHMKMLIAAGSGACGGLIGSPADMINVRMQNDVILAPDKRRNYKHAVDGLIRVLREEGVRTLFAGGTTATARAILMTVGQLSFYDQAKQTLLRTGYFADDVTAHFTASLIAGGIATTMTQPVDVIKTVTMNAKPGEFRGMWHIITHTAKLGPRGFFRGYVPRFVRLGPHTVLMFVFLEQLRLNFGDLPSAS